jgi:large subunit ribosomal protein L17
MRHQVAGRRLNRTSEHLQALLGNLVTALIQHEQIRTTLPKAKEARRVAERLITLAKDGTLHHRRHVARMIRDPGALAKLFGTLGPRFKARPGGYTRIVKLGRRLGDNAAMALLELVERTPRASPSTQETKDQKAGLEPSAPPEKAAKRAKKSAETAESDTPEREAKAPKTKAPKAKAAKAPKKKSKDKE